MKPLGQLWAKMGSSVEQGGARGVQDVALEAQDGVKWPQDGPKMRHTGFQMAQDGAKTRQDRSRRVRMNEPMARWALDGPE